MWLHRGSEEPSPTEVVCYWKKPSLSNIGSSKTILKAANIGRQLQQHSIVMPDSTHFLEEVVAGMKCEKYGCPISIHYGQVNDIKKLSVHQLMMEFAYDDSKCFINEYVNKCIKVIGRHLFCDKRRQINPIISGSNPGCCRWQNARLQSPWSLDLRNHCKEDALR
ncbi:hypothetical protein RN001_002774 [Aquatica leii]|uniref:Uncharacterized protein n=1 Tax=Aquatica leii TaxID=1421715 RepID=A0AAN7QNQ0_9COLE|nr:hypothetical protein RN001_002774 [Aquatica leii]